MLAEWICIRKKYQFDRSHFRYELSDVFTSHLKPNDESIPFPSGGYVCDCGMIIKEGNESSGMDELEGLDGIWKFEHKKKEIKNKKIGEKTWKQ